MFSLEHLSATGESCFPILLDGALKGLAALMVTGLVTLAMRRSSAAARHLVWFLGTSSLLVLPVLSWTLPAWYLLPRLTKEKAASTPVAEVRAVEVPPAVYMPPPPQPARDSGQILADAASSPRSEPTVTDLLPMPRKTSTTPVPDASHWQLSWPTCVVLAWLVGVILSLLHVLLGYASLWRLQRGSLRMESGSPVDLVVRLSSQVGLRRPVELLSDSSRTMPMTWGLWRTRVLLPKDASNWADAQCRTVLLHELAHAKRHDCLTQLFVQFARALHWFNPLAWLAWRRIQAERERACDDLVLASGTKASAYAEQLLQIASDSPPIRLSAAVIAMARHSSLEGRLLAILDDKLCRRALTRRSIALLTLLFVAILTPIGMLRAMASNSETGPGASPAPSPTSKPAVQQTSPAPSTNDRSENRPSPGRGFALDLGDGLTLEMVWIPKGAFKMGSPPSEEGRRENEGPVHTVEVDGFWMGKHEVTQEQYERLMDTNPSLFKGPKNPVECMSWCDAIAFCEKLPKRAGLRFALPSEAQWEFACRAGSRSRFCFGDSDSELGEYAWIATNADHTTHPVGTKRASAFGVHDMHGNVAELCADDWHENYNSAPSDGWAWIDGSTTSRTGRGGAWCHPPAVCRSAFRDSCSLINRDRRLGFRVAAIPTIAARAHTISGTVVATTSYSDEYFAALELAVNAPSTQEAQKALADLERERPVPGVVVTLRGKSASMHTITDSQGKFRFSDLAAPTSDPSGGRINAEEYEVTAAHLMPTPQRELATAREQVKLEGNRDVTLNLRADLITVAGRVVDTDGKPIASVKVTGEREITSEVEVHGQTVTALSRADGSYELRGFFPADVRRTAGYLHGFDPTAAHGLDPPPFYLVVRAEVDDYAQKRSTVPKVPLVSENLVTNARRLSQIMLAAYKRSPEYERRKKSGKSERSDQEKPGVFLPHSKGNTITDVDIVLEHRPLGRISGRVIDTQGKPRPDRILTLSPTRSSGDEYADRPGFGLTTGDGGAFGFQKVAPGQYSVVVESAPSGGRQFHQIPTQGSMLDLKPGETLKNVEIVIHRPEDFAVSGHVRDARGNPVGNAYVFLPIDTPCWTMTDSSGAYRLEGLDGTGLSVFKITLGHNGPSIIDIPMNARNVDLVMPDKGSIEGVVRDARTNRPIAAYELKVPLVRLANAKAVWENPDVRIDQKTDGRFTMTNVPAGEVTVAVHAEGFADREYVTSVEAGKGAPLECGMVGLDSSKEDSSPR
jgi:formylglycine-generating enzyme required for sulfatase activity/beta-lactamase regulating signal transducer with metallopeptidase domain